MNMFLCTVIIGFAVLFVAATIKLQFQFYSNFNKHSRQYLLGKSAKVPYSVKIFFGLCKFMEEDYAYLRMLW